MSRGPGKIERAIRQLMADQPTGAWTVEDLCERVYTGINWVEKKHRVSVLRALKRAVHDDVDWILWTSDTIGGAVVLVNMSNVESYGLARLKSDWLHHYRSNDPRIHEERIWSEKDLLRCLAPGGRDHEYIQPGGAWHRHVQRHIAEQDGDQERLVRLSAEQDAAMSAIFSKQ